MIGLLTLSSGILCSKEALGKVFDCVIAGVHCQLHFPRFPLINENNPEIGSGNPLLAPEMAINMMRGGEPINWGVPMNYPPGDSFVKCLGVTVDCEKAKALDVAQKLYRSISKWEESFQNYLRLEKKLPFGNGRERTEVFCGLELIEDKYIPLENFKATLSRGDLMQPPCYATEDEIRKAIAYADSGKAIRLEYRLMLSCYEALANGENRLAILDACSAMELCLNEQIKKNCESEGINADVALSQPKSLGNKIKYVKKKYHFVPDCDVVSAVDLRNGVMHSRVVSPSYEQTINLVNCVNKYLERFNRGYVEE